MNILNKIFKNVQYFDNYGLVDIFVLMLQKKVKLKLNQKRNQKDQMSQLPRKVMMVTKRVESWIIFLIHQTSK